MREALPRDTEIIWKEDVEIISDEMLRTDFYIHYEEKKHYLTMSDVLIISLNKTKWKITFYIRFLLPSTSYTNALIHLSGFSPNWFTLVRISVRSEIVSWQVLFPA